LIADDDEMNAKLLNAMISPLGYETVFAMDDMEAKDSYTQGHRHFASAGFYTMLGKSGFRKSLLPDIF
jgi:CheY-like chemotaxis protein